MAAAAHAAPTLKRLHQRAHYSNNNDNCYKFSTWPGYSNAAEPFVLAAQPPCAP